MKPLYQRISLTLFGVFYGLHGWAAYGHHHAKHAHVRAPILATTQTQTLPDFENVVAGYNVDLKILKRPKHLKAHNTMRSPIGSTLRPRWVGHTLVLENGLTRTPVTLFVDHLHHLTAISNANIHVAQVPTRQLVVHHNTTGNIVLKGHIQMHALHQQGSGQTSAYWIDSPDLDIDGTQGHVKLAGHVKHLSVDGRNAFVFQGKDLRAKQIWVRSDQYAQIHLMPLHSLFASAHQNSRITYHHFLPTAQVVALQKGHAQILYLQPKTSSTTMADVRKHGGRKHHKR